MNKENIKNWLKVNLFSNWYNSIISLFVLFVFFSIISSFVDWAIIKATFIGKIKIKKNNINGLIFGFTKKALTTVKIKIINAKLTLQSSLSG